MSSNPSAVKYRPTPWDALVVAAVVALGILVSVFVYGPGTSQPLTCVVTVDGQVADRAPLADFEGIHTYTGSGHTLTLSVDDGQVQILDSDCPGQDCVHSGPITRAGQSIVCLPARIVVHLESDDRGPDLVIG